MCGRSAVRGHIVLEKTLLEVGLVQIGVTILEALAGPVDLLVALLFRAAGPDLAVTYEIRRPLNTAHPEGGRMLVGREVCAVDLAEVAA